MSEPALFQPLPAVPYRAEPTPRTDKEFPFTTADFETIAALVYEHSGIVLGTHKRDMVYSRLARRLRGLRLNSFNEYCKLLSSGSEEIGSLINAITTNLTKFFREPHHFEHFRNVALAEIWKQPARAKPRVRVWSAGCSSGEEPYTIAMTAMAAQRAAGREWDFRILATDLDTSILAKAQAGVYPLQALEGVPETMRDTAFEKQSGRHETVQVAHAVQALITFKQLNLLGAWPMGGPFDAIFCRNVMIYFDAETKSNLISRFHGLLKAGGWLYVGHSESLLDQQERFKLSGHTVYRRIG